MRRALLRWLLLGVGHAELARSPPTPATAILLFGMPPRLGGDRNVTSVWETGLELMRTRAFPSLLVSGAERPDPTRRFSG